MKSTISILVLPLLLVTSVLALPLNNFEDGNGLLNDMRFPKGDLHTVIPYESMRWPKGIVIFRIDQAFSEAEKQDIKRGFMIISSTTCVTFREATSEMDYVYIMRGKGCSSAVGKMRGAQIVTLESNGFCTSPGVVAHEMLHTIGLFHEMQRPDRDDHVIVLWDNISGGQQSNFWKVPNLLDYGTKYDYLSIMHYGARTGSKNGKPVMVNTEGRVVKMGQLKMLTEADIIKVNAMHIIIVNDLPGN